MNMNFTAMTLAVVLALSLVACDDGKRRNPPPTPTAACGNNQINGVELCDGTAFARGGECADYGLANGQVGCTSACRLDFSGCSYQDYCTANGLYGDGACDPCDALGGVRDPDCDVVCGADGVCGDVYDPLVDAYTCRRAGRVDPDCGLCGNRILEGSELCDGTAWNPNTFTCEAYGYYGGQIACRQDCGPDFSGCLASNCGDGRLEGDEECEGTDVGELTCADFDGVAGEVSCSSDCKIDSSACVAPGCGNNVVEPATEECDGTSFGAASCVTRGFAGGALSCTEACAIDDSECIPPGCQNGIKEEGEDCEYTDGVPNLGGATCESLGFLPTPGAVICDPETCTFDTGTCVAAGCGNGVVEAPVEECEGVGTRTCAQLGLQGGTASCVECRWDRSACTGCGNGIIEVGEQCEGTNLNARTCQTQGFSGGILACGAGCQFDTSGCTGGVVGCGNGVLEPGELCDGTQFIQAYTCAGLQLGTGVVTCSSKCTPNFSGCTMSDLCAELGYYDDPWCDPCEAWGGSPDPACSQCGADSVCAGYWDVLSGLRDTCLVATGARDPDCLQTFCGDGQIGGWNLGDGTLLAEPCDGTSFAFDDANQCSAYGSYTGAVTCTNDCQLNFAACQ